MPVKSSQVARAQSTRSPSLESEFVLGLHPEAFDCFCMDVRMNGVYKQICMNNDLVGINVVVELSDVSVTLPCIRNSSCVGQYICTDDSFEGRCISFSHSFKPTAASFPFHEPHNPLPVALNTTVVLSVEKITRVNFHENVLTIRVKPCKLRILVNVPVETL